MFLFKRSGYYQIQYFDEINNKVKRKSTGQKTKQNALKYLSEFRENQKNKPRSEIISLVRFRKEYETFASLNFSKKHTQNIKLAFDKLLGYIKPDIPLAKLNGRILETFFSEYFQRSKYGASLIHRVLNSSFNKAVKWNYIDINPLSKIKLPKIPLNNPIFVTIEEFYEIMKFVESRDLKDIYIFGFFTGCRLSEILNMKWSNINLNDGIIKVNNSETFTTKSKKERIIPVSMALKDMLISRIPKIHRIDDEYIFYKLPGVPYLPNYVSHNFKIAVKQAKVNQSFHMHSLRHGFASRLVQNGVSLYVVKELLGHADVSTTQQYSHLQKEHLKNAIDQLDKISKIG